MAGLSVVGEPTGSPGVSASLAIKLGWFAYSVTMSTKDPLQINPDNTLAAVKVNITACIKSSERSSHYLWGTQLSKSSLEIYAEAQLLSWLFPI
jgi:hypothetical protein